MKAHISSYVVSQKDQVQGTAEVSGQPGFHFEPRTCRGLKFRGPPPADFTLTNGPGVSIKILL